MLQTRTSGEGHTPVQKLPDPAICRGKRAGFGDFVDCLVATPRGCAYALPFGNGYLCENPARNEIVALTVALQRAMAIRPKQSGASRLRER